MDRGAGGVGYCDTDPLVAAIDMAYLHDYGGVRMGGSPMADTVRLQENHPLVPGSFEGSPTQPFPASADRFSTKELESARWLT